WVPFLRELWSSAEQQQNYLMGVPEGADLGITPLSDPKNHYLIINGESELLSDGTLEGSFTIKGEGQTDASVRRIFTRDYKSEWKENVERELLRINPRAKVVEMDYGDDPMDYQSGPIKMKISYKIPGYAFTGNNMLAFVPLVANNLFISAMPHLYIDTDIKDRKYNFRDRCSRFVDLTETITIPEGFGAIEPVFSTSVEGKEVNYQGGYHQDGNKIIMDQEITLSKRIYEPEDWCKMREVILAQKTIQEKPIILVKQ
nr:transglutaminase [Bacteroidota bacterium]